MAVLQTHWSPSGIPLARSAAERRIQGWVLELPTSDDRGSLCQPKGLHGVWHLHSVHNQSLCQTLRDKAVLKIQNNKNLEPDEKPKFGRSLACRCEKLSLTPQSLGPREAFVEALGVLDGTF